MGFLRNIANRIKEADQAREDIDDNRTTDRHLRSLRRQSRVQDEEIEKELLKQKVKAYEQNRGEILANLNKKKEYLKKKKHLEEIRFFSKGNL